VVAFPGLEAGKEVIVMVYFDHVIKVSVRFSRASSEMSANGCKSVYVVGFGILYFNKLYLNYFFSKE